MPVKHFYQEMRITRCQTFESRFDKYENIPNKYTIVKKKSEEAPYPRHYTLIPVPIFVFKAVLLWVGIANPHVAIKTFANEVEKFAQYKERKKQKALDAIQGGCDFNALIKTKEYEKLDEEDYTNYVYLRDNARLDGQVFIGCATEDKRPFTLRFININRFTLFLQFYVTINSEKGKNESNFKYRSDRKLNCSKIFDDCSVDKKVNTTLLYGVIPMLQKISDEFNCCAPTDKDKKNLEKLHVYVTQRAVATVGTRQLGGIHVFNKEVNEAKNNQEKEIHENGSGYALYISSKVQDFANHDIGHSFMVQSDWFHQNYDLPRVSYCSSQYSYLLSYKD